MTAAPAACDTIFRNLKDFGRQPSDYDKNITGDLEKVGQQPIYTSDKITENFRANQRLRVKVGSMTDCPTGHTSRQTIRQSRKVRHSIKDILIIVLFATLANADTWEEAADFARWNEVLAVKGNQGNLETDIREYYQTEETGFMPQRKQ